MKNTTYIRNLVISLISIAVILAVIGLMTVDIVKNRKPLEEESSTEVESESFSEAEKIIELVVEVAADEMTDANETHETEDELYHEDTFVESPMIEIVEAPREDYDSSSMKMYVTAYTAEEGFYEGAPTASGAPVGYGVCAMNSGQMSELGVSYGDEIYIDGLGTYTVLDCGCDWGVVDVWTYTNEEAYNITGTYDVTF